MKLSFANRIRQAFASLFYIGYFPYGSGTVASAIVALAMWFTRDKLALLLGPHHAMNYWFAILAVTGVSFYLASKSRELFGSEDAPQIVIDEVAGQFVTFFMVPFTFKTLALGFLLFRFFDIIKPFPVYAMEDIEDGVGVTMDDVAAGVLANISLIVILAVYHAIRARL